MKNLTKQSIIGLFAGVVFFLVASCTSAPNVVGKWRAVGEPGTLEFHKDGSFEVIDNMGAISQGKYVLDKNGNVKIVLTHSDIMREHIQPVDEPEIVSWCKSLKLAKMITDSVSHFPNTHRDMFLLGVTQLTIWLALKTQKAERERRTVPKDPELSQVVKAGS